MGYVNVIWQGDANRAALELLPLAAAPPFVVNVTGARDAVRPSLAIELGKRLGKPPRFEGAEASDALLSDTTVFAPHSAPNELPLDVMLDWVAEWVRDGRPLARKAHAIRSAGRARSDDRIRPRRARAHAPGRRRDPGASARAHRARMLDERRQRALTRYYVAAGAGGIAVGVHTTQFAIRERITVCIRPVLELAAETVRRSSARRAAAAVRAASPASSATRRRRSREAEIALDVGYDAGLLSLGALRDGDDEAMLAHCRAVADVIPLFGFYLQPAVGGRVLGLCVLARARRDPEVVAIKIAPFDRYKTIDVVRAMADAGRDDVALYTGNDDSIVADLVTPVSVAVGGRSGERAASSADCSASGRCGRVAPSTCSAGTRRARRRRDRRRAACARRRAHRRQWRDLRRCATASPAASPAFTRCCGDRDCSRERGASIHARRCRPVRPSEIDRVMSRLSVPRRRRVRGRAARCLAGLRLKQAMPTHVSRAGRSKHRRYDPALVTTCRTQVWSRTSRRSRPAREHPVAPRAAAPRLRRGRTRGRPPRARSRGCSRARVDRERARRSSSPKPARRSDRHRSRESDRPATRARFAAARRALSSPRGSCLLPRAACWRRHHSADDRSRRSTRARRREVGRNGLSAWSEDRLSPSKERLHTKNAKLNGAHEQTLIRALRGDSCAP